MTQPYSYVITWYPTSEQLINGDTPRVIAHGMVVSSSIMDAFTKMIPFVPKEEDVEQVEFMAKPFIESSSCQTKKDIGKSFLYNFYMNNDILELQSTTYNINELIKNSFNNQNNYSYSQDVPNVMMMVDILALLNNDKTL